MEEELEEERSPCLSYPFQRKVVYGEEGSPFFSEGAGAASEAVDASYRDALTGEPR